MLEERLSAVFCAICNKPVRLDECKVTDLGEPAHEACIADQLKEEIKKRKALAGSARTLCAQCADRADRFSL